MEIERILSIVPIILCWIFELAIEYQFSSLNDNLKDKLEWVKTAIYGIMWLISITSTVIITYLLTR